MTKRRWDNIYEITEDGKNLPQLITPQMPVAVSKQTEKNLYPALSYLLDEVRKELSLIGTSLDVATPTTLLLELVERQAIKLSLELTNGERDLLLKILEREQEHFGILQSLIDNPDVTDIIVSDYQDIAIQQCRNTITTDAHFSSRQSYEAFVEKLLSRAGTSYSTKKPIADGMIGGDVRIHAVHRSLCESGPYLTLRIHRHQNVPQNALANMGFCPPQIENYLGVLANEGHTFLVVGEVGTGKTTLARALASHIPERESILVIEDTPEIRLHHPHVRYIRTRESNTEGEGKIAPSSCIRAGMRMAMNRIIFGEIRDAEAAEAFIDVCSSGHPGISTFHARSASEAITRLELLLGRSQPGVGRDMLLNQIGTAVEVLIHVGVCHLTKERRIFEIREIGGFADGVVRYRDIFKYQCIRNTPTWKLTSRASMLKNEDGGHFLQGLPPLLTLIEKVRLDSEGQLIYENGAQK